MTASQFEDDADALGGGLPPLPEQPYPGLRPFAPDEWPLFFGRESMTQDVVSRLAEKHFVAVHGDSGCGKSSLIAAGVMPFLQHDQARAGGSWFTTIMRPEDAPLGNLARALAGPQQASDPGRALAIRRLLNRGADSPLAVAKFLGCDEGNNVCILFDQFEELFEYARRGGQTEAGLITDFLVGLTAKRPPGLHAILTMRSDYLGQCAQYRGFAETVNETQYLVPRMERPALIRAIREPAELFGGSVDMDLTSRLIADAGVGQDQLPLIQHGLMLMWRRKAGDSGVAHLTLDDYKAEGDLAAQLSRHADEVMAQAIASPDEEHVVEDMFRALTDRNPEGLAIRRRKSLAQLVEITGAPRETLVRIIDRFRAPDASFLRPYGTAPLNDEDVIDVSHEAFIRNWQRIREPGTGWLDREAEDGLIWTSLRIAAGTFAKNPEALLSPAAGEERAAWLEQHNTAWAERYGGGWDEVSALVSQSRAAVQLAGERKAAQRRRLLIGGMAALLTVFLGLTAWALYQSQVARQLAEVASAERSEADKQRQLAEEQRSEAEKQSQLAEQKAEEARRLAEVAQAESAEAARQRAEAEKQRQLAEQQSAEAEKQRLLAEEQSAEAEKQRQLAEEQSAKAEALRVQAELQRQSAEANAEDALRSAKEAAAKTQEAILNETAGIAATSGAALFEFGAAEATKLAVAGWPRVGDENRPPLALTIDRLSRALAELRERYRYTFDNAVYWSAYSPDGKRIAIAGAEQAAHVYDVETGAEVLPPLQHGGSIYALTYSADGSRIATASGDKTARVFDAWSGEQQLILGNHTEVVNFVAFSPDGTRIATVSNDKTTRIWDAGTGAELFVLGNHTDMVVSVDFSPDGSKIVTASWDNTARVWDVAKGTELKVLQGHQNRVYGASFSPDGTKIVTASLDRTVIVWNAETGEQIMSLVGHTNAVNWASFSCDGYRIVSGSADNTARVWNAETGEPIAILKGHTASVYAASFSPDGFSVLTASQDRSARIWDVSAGIQIASLRGHGDQVISANYSPDGQRLVTASADKSVRVWDAATGEQLMVLNGHTESVIIARYSPDGRFILSSSRDKTARIWNAETGQTVRVLSGHSDVIWSIAISPDSSMVATASADKSVRVWNAQTGALIAILNGHTDQATAVAFSPDGKTLATGSLDATIRLWELPSGRQVSQLNGHTNTINSINYSPDGTLVATSSWDKTARIWETATGKAIAVLTGHDQPIWSVAFSPDGKRLMTAASPSGGENIKEFGDKTVRIWDVGTGATVMTINAIENTLNSASFSPDGTRIAIASDDTTASIWDISSLEEGNAFEIACQRLGRNTSLNDVVSFYRLGTIVPICGENGPLSIDIAKVMAPKE